MSDLTKIGREVRRLRSGRGRRYPATLRQRIVRAVRDARDKGSTWPSIEDDLDVPFETLRRWLADIDAEPSELKPVVVADPIVVEARDVVVVTPSGYRVEGLDVDGAATLLRKLSS
jgi:hypothetical protein